MYLSRSLNSALEIKQLTRSHLNPEQTNVPLFVHNI